MIRHAGRNRAQRRVQFVGREPVDFRSRMARSIDQDQIIALRRRNADEEGRVFFLIDQRVFARLQAALIHGVRPPIGIARHPEDRLAGLAPLHRPVSVINQNAGIGARLDILDTDLIEFAAFQVCAIRDELVIRGNLDVAKGKIVLPLAQRVAVQQQRLGRFCIERVRGRPARKHGILPALAIPRIIRPRTINIRNRAVILLDAPAHLGKQLLAQRCRRLFQNRLGEGVLRFQIFADIRAQQRRLAHHLLPVFILQPVVRIVPRAAELGDLVINALGHRRRRP